MKQATIRAILRTRLNEVPDRPPVLWEATGAEALDETYLEDELRLGAIASLSNGQNQCRPFYLLTLKSPEDRRLAELDTLPDRIVDAFQPGRTLTDSDRTHFVEIETATPGPLRTENGWGIRTITLGLSCLAFRTAFTPA